MMQERKLRKRLSQLEEVAVSVGTHGGDNQSKAQDVVSNAAQLFHNIQGMERWKSFQKGMLSRSVAAAQNRLESD
jgi:hypothetical protein